MNRPSDVEKLSSDKRLAWRALHFRCAALLYGSRPFCGGGLAGSRYAHRHGHGLIPNGHTLANGPTVAMGMLSNHVDLLHSYCDEEGCICMEYILNLAWTEGAPS